MGRPHAPRAPRRLPRAWKRAHLPALPPPAPPGKLNLQKKELGVSALPAWHRLPPSTWREEGRVTVQPDPFEVNRPWRLGILGDLGSGACGARSCSSARRAEGSCARLPIPSLLRLPLSAAPDGRCPLKPAQPPAVSCLQGCDFGLRAGGRQ